MFDARDKLQGSSRGQNRIRRLRVPLLQAPAAGADVCFERSLEDEGAAREVGLSWHGADHGRRDQVKYVTTSLALLGARLGPSRGADTCADV